MDGPGMVSRVDERVGQVVPRRGQPNGIDIQWQQRDRLLQ